MLGGRNFSQVRNSLKPSGCNNKANELIKTQISLLRAGDFFIIRLIKHDIFS